MTETKKTTKPAAAKPKGKYVATVGIDYDPAEMRIEAGDVADGLPESVLKSLLRSGAVEKADS